MKKINESGELADSEEKELGDAIGEMIDDFGPDFDAEGNPLEEGESDRVRSEEERARPGRTAPESAVGEGEEADEREPEEVPA